MKKSSKPSSASEAIRSYQVLGISHHKNLQSIRNSGMHQYREQHTPNADPARSHLNYDLTETNSSDSLVRNIEKRLEMVLVKKNSILATELLISASHEAFIENGGHLEHQKFFHDSLNWAKGKFGRENIIMANVQLDEATPHLVIFITPVIFREGKSIHKQHTQGTSKKQVEAKIKPKYTLSAKTLTNGRANYISMHDGLYDSVSKLHKLERGIYGSKASHKKISHFYQMLDKVFVRGNLELAVADVTGKKGIFSKESMAHKTDRINTMIAEHYAPHLARSLDHTLIKERLTALEATLKEKNAVIKNLELVLIETKKLHEEQIEKIIKNNLKNEHQSLTKIMQKKSDTIEDSVGSGANLHKSGESNIKAREEKIKALKKMSVEDILAQPEDWIVKTLNEWIIPYQELTDLLMEIDDTSWFDHQGNLTELGYQKKYGAETAAESNNVDSRERVDEKNTSGGYDDVYADVKNIKIIGR